MRARSALFTLFGDVVRPAGGEAWLTTLTGCMGALGFTPEATRTALHRMAAEGWVRPRKVGRYAVYELTDDGVDRLEEAAARIYRLRAVDWDGRWRLLVCPGLARDSELGRALRWMGFGRLSADTWVSPHAHRGRLDAVIARHEAPAVLRFVTDPQASDPARDERIVATAWNLEGLHAAHAEFVERWGSVEPPTDPKAAFATRIRLVHDWRSFLHLDPGLPVSLLPGDWLGDEAAACFKRRYEAVEEPAWRFYDLLASSTPPGLLEASRPAGPVSTFSGTLDALQTRTPTPA